MIEATTISKEQTALYATASDFCRIFKQDMNNLYLLSLLLTADPEKAEQCFLSGLDDCAAGNQVFQEWARSWARRAIIKNAIRLIAPEPPQVDDVNSNSKPAVSAGAKELAGDLARPELRAELTVLLNLQPFDRFVFVMSALEGYSYRDCTLLLGCTRDTLIAARSRALLEVARSGQQVGADLKPEPLSGNRKRVLEMRIPAHLATTA